MAATARGHEPVARELATGVAPRAMLCCEVGSELSREQAVVDHVFGLESVRPLVGPGTEGPGHGFTQRRGACWPRHQAPAVSPAVTTSSSCL